MTWPQRTLLTLTLCLISPWTLPEVSSESESGSEPYPQSSLFSSQRPIINYRTNILGVRYGDPVSPTNSTLLIPRLTVKSYEEPKTEIHAPIYQDEDEEIEDAPGITEDPFHASTSRIPTIPASLRRNFDFLTHTTTSSPSPLQDSKSKTSKNKSTRRRKVKRPPKPKSTTPKSNDDDLGIPDPSASKSSSGDKNLALEIGSGDGKYALINHFFGNTTQPQAPGIISYSPSDDFVTDNAKTLGNVAANDIWLSEGHLLVLKGGYFDSKSRDKWKPIDPYERDKSKPVLRIPLDTDNPPPFPVFVNESGPPIFLGPPPPFPIPGYGDFNESFDPSQFPPPGLIPLFPNGSIPEIFGVPPHFNPGNNSFPHHNFPPPRFPPPPGGLYGINGVNGPPGGLYGGGGPPTSTYGNGYGAGANDTFPPPFYPFSPPGGTLNHTRLPPPPLFPFGPPGHPFPPPPGFNPNFTGNHFPFLPPLVLNPKDNETDDPSIFLPPPYDFEYHEDNTTIVPPGPFAPGLVVPPPKEFYIVYNKTKPTLRPVVATSVPTTSLHAVAFPSLRPNAKRPKFPITNPPDDSLEASLPQITPISPITFPKKRKQGRGKTEKIYSNDNTEEMTEGETPYPTVTPSPQIGFRPKQVTPTTKPHNYVYVRGRLKTLAEIAAEAVADAGFEKISSTSPPPFDELGYPNRDFEQNSPLGYEIPQKRKTLTKTPKVYFTNQNIATNQLNPTVYPNALTQIDHHLSTLPVVKPSSNSNIQLNPLIYSQENPSPQLHTPNVNNHQPNNHNNDQGNVLYYQRNPYLHQTPNQGLLGPTYFTTTTLHNNANHQEPKTPSQIFKALPHYSRQENLNPHSGSYTPHLPSSTTPTHPSIQSTFNPPLHRKRLRSRIIFPDEEDRRQLLLQQQQQFHPTPIYNPIIYQTPQPQGYFSPISQYRTTLSGQFVPNTFPINSGSRSPGTFTTQFYHPQIQQQPSPFFHPQQQSKYQQQPQYDQQQPQYDQQQPQYQQQQLQYAQQQLQYAQQQPQYAQQQPQYAQQQSQYAQHQPQYENQQLQYQQQQPQNTYPIHQLPEESGQAVPLHRDILINYREPLPQYNTESETVTTRSIVKAGPSSPGIICGTQTPPPPATPTLPAASKGSFYSFERGGPGGFSYKIHL